ncbi:MAG: hypothetical protein AAF438_06770 [Pseudomonadota bacterium]
MNRALLYEIADLSTSIIRGFHDEDKQPEVDQALRLIGVVGRLAKELQLDKAEYDMVVAAAEGGEVSNDVIDGAHAKLRETLGRF